MTIDLTNDEALMISYALSEIANRRQEQSIDFNSKHAAKEAEQHRKLALKIRLHIPKADA